MSVRLAAVGLSHHTAPVDVRERLAIPGHAVPELLQRLRDEGIGSEGVLVSTCNRVELYAVPAPGRTVDDVAAFLARAGGMDLSTAAPHLYRLREREVLRHLFRVASSLDSMILGEPQILGQVKDAYLKSADAGGAGPMLRRVMDRALNVAKRVRTETGIGREAVSVGRAGVELARHVIGDLEGRSALLIGAGAHGKLIARSMLSYGLQDLIVANRTRSRGDALADLLGAHAVGLEEVDAYLAKVDVVMTSTAAGRVLIDRARMAPITRKRRYRPLVMIDVSVPRNIDPGVNDLEGIYRFDVDDLSEVAQQGAERRRAAADDAEVIIVTEVKECWKLLMTSAASQSIGAVVKRAESIRQAELQRAKGPLADLDPRQRAAVEAMTKAIVKKVLHAPLTEARRLAADGNTEHLGRLFEALGGQQAAEPPRGKK